MEDFETFIDCNSRGIRLTNERWKHILDHPEMEDQRIRLEETVSNPDVIIATLQDESIHAYHRFYETTPVTRKYMVVAVKILEADAFIVTAFYNNRQKKGTVVWQR